METIFKVFVATISLVLLFTQCEKEPNPYDPVDFPDQALLNALIEEGIDSNGDGKISYKEASQVLSLDIHNKGITETTGIEAFVNLETLLCGCDPLTSLDVSKNTALTYLSCHMTELISLDISNNTELIDLKCFSNQLTSLDVSTNSKLERLMLWENQLTSLDVSNNIALNRLWCGGNQLSSLDVSNNIALSRLWCSDNQLSSLDVSNNTALTNLGCSNNQLSNLDVSNNTELTSLWISDMPTLFEVCVWEEFYQDSLEIGITDSPNVYFTTDCN